MRYSGQVYRPPSEAYSYILQATLGCSWNKCTYCDMYRAKDFSLRPLDEVFEDITMAHDAYGEAVDKVFVADGDALIMPVARWLKILEALYDAFPKLKRMSCYAMATNVQEKTPEELQELSAAGLTLLYIGPESGDEVTLKRIAKGSTYADHVDAASKAHEANLGISAIFLLGAGGVARSREHAEASAQLATAMDPKYLAALTLTIVPGTPLARMEEKGLFELPDIRGLLGELRTFVSQAKPTDALFRTNHASNYLPIGGRLPADGPQMAQVIDEALRGDIPLRPEMFRGL